MVSVSKLCSQKSEMLQKFLEKESKSFFLPKSLNSKILSSAAEKSVGLLWGYLKNMSGGGGWRGGGGGTFLAKISKNIKSSQPKNAWGKKWAQNYRAPKMFRATEKKVVVEKLWLDMDNMLMWWYWLTFSTHNTIRTMVEIKREGCEFLGETGLILFVTYIISLQARKMLPGAPRTGVNGRWNFWRVFLYFWHFGSSSSIYSSRRARPAFKIHWLRFSWISLCFVVG